MRFFLEVLISGLLSGVMYSLVALGFVLIYKASGVFNFAQGAMVYSSGAVGGWLHGEGRAAVAGDYPGLRHHDPVRHCH
jgi:branched-subunit amino acid ABC-type transport system permease component